MSSFQDKSAIVVAVDSSGAVRQLMTDVIRQCGFEKVQAFATLQDALNMMEVERVDWIITPMGLDQEIHALHLLKICSEVPELAHVRTTVLVEETELYSLPIAFELGAFSWINKPFTKDSFLQELQSNLEILENNEWDATLTAATYIRKILTEEKRFQPLLELEKSLLNLYPGHPELLLQLATPQFETGHKTEAKLTLNQVKLIDPNMESAVSESAQRLFGEEGLDLTDEEKESTAGANILGLKDCIVVDSDEASASSVEDALKDLGAENVHRFTDGESALEFISSYEGEPSAIIHEWRIPKVTGPLFIQRVRQAGKYTAPLIVLSSLIEKNDQPLVKEMGVANISSKPFSKKDFITDLIWTIQQERLPTETQTMERKLRQLMAAKNDKELAALKVRFTQDPKVPLSRKKTVEAEYAYHKKDFQKARDVGIEALKLAGDSIILLNLLGKILMQLQDFSAALACFKKAQTLSPLNIERLCAIAEAHSELGNTEEAQKTIDEANTLDPGNPVAQETEAKLAFSAGDYEKAKSLMTQLDSLNNIISFMNNKAVAMARCDLFDESIDLYRKALKSVPDDRQEIKAIVYYNMALAFLRNSELEEGLLQLERCLKLSNPKLAPKAKSLRSRVKHALDRFS